MTTQKSTDVVEAAIREAEALIKGGSGEGKRGGKTTVTKAKTEHQGVEDAEGEPEEPDEKEDAGDDAAGASAKGEGEEINPLSEQPDVQKAINVSPWIAAQTEYVEKSLAAHDVRLGVFTDAVLKSQTQLITALDGLRKGLAEAKDLSAKQAERIERLEKTPDPRRSLTKGENPERFPGDRALTRARVAARMVEMVQKGEIAPTELIRFESTGELSLQVRAALQNTMS